MGRDAESGAGTGERPRPGGPSQSPAAGARAGTHRAYGAECDGDGAAGPAGGRAGRAGLWAGAGGRCSERKSVRRGKSVSMRVELGGRPIIIKKNLLHISSSHGQPNKL